MVLNFALKLETRSSNAVSLALPGGVCFGGLTSGVGFKIEVLTGGCCIGTVVGRGGSLG